MSDRDDAFLVAQDAEREGRWELAMQIRASVFDGNLTVDGCSYDVPWNRGAWNGSFVSLDGAATDDFTSDDVDAVLAYGDTDTCDTGAGTTAGIIRLKDGRFVSLESSYDVTGSGFHEDAYGGDADIWFSTTAGAALEKISEQCREILKWG